MPLELPLSAQRGAIEPLVPSLQVGGVTGRPQCQQPQPANTDINQESLASRLEQCMDSSSHRIPYRLLQQLV